jgi:anaerobic dimethyl sulfoxide reductase subunit C (anchor subunit)
MKERSLIVFTIFSQLAVGMFWTLGALYVWSARQIGPGVAHELTTFGWPLIGLVMGIGILASFFHLGAPLNSWRAFSNLRQSWLSREILFATLFAIASITMAIMQWLELGTLAARGMMGVITGLVGLALVYVMGNAYRLRTIPAWDTWATPASFFVTTFLLGALATGVMLMSQSKAPAEWMRLVLQGIVLWAITLLGIELVIIPLWLVQLTGSEAATNSVARITQKHSAIFKLRLALTVAAITVAGAAIFGLWQEFSLLVALGLVLVSETLGRLLFYSARVRRGV